MAYNAFRLNTVIREIVKENPLPTTITTTNIGSKAFHSSLFNAKFFQTLAPRRLISWSKLSFQLSLDLPISLFPFWPSVKFS
jgi:hypothetical protein